MRRRGGAGDLSGRVSVVRVDGMGDGLLTLPLIHELTLLESVEAVQFVSVPALGSLMETNFPDVEFVDGSLLARKASGSYRRAHEAAGVLLRDAVWPFAPEVVLAPRSDHNDLAVYELVGRSHAARASATSAPSPARSAITRRLPPRRWRPSSSPSRFVPTPVATKQLWPCRSAGASESRRRSRRR